MDADKTPSGAGESSPAPDGSAALKACQFAVSDILLAALSGSDKTLRTADGFVRWGEVEHRIRYTIELRWPNATALPPLRCGGGQEQIVRRDGYQFCEKHQQEYRQYCSGCACGLPAANSPICLTGAKGGGDPDKPPCARAIWPCPTCGAVDMADAGNKCRADWVCAADDQRQADYEAEQAAKGGGE